MTTSGSLAGLRFLVVEDETLVAILIEDMLVDFGCVIAGTAGTVAKALAIVARDGVDLDGAVLDVNVGGELVFPVADALARRNIPFVFSTGYGRSGVSGDYADRPVVAKPFHPRVFRQALVTAMTRESLCLDP